MRLFFVVNPTAGHGRTLQVWRRLEPHLAQWGEYDVGFTTAPRHGEALAREAARAGFDRVVAMGGDGTLNEVVNGLIGERAALGIIPSGTGNDFVRSLGVPRDPLAAARIAFTAPVRPVDVGLHLETGRHFINIAGIGFDAEVAEEVNTRRILKAIPGTFPSLVAALITLIRYRNPEMTIRLDGKEVRRRVLLMAVGNARYYGGGMQILPQATVDDGYFTVLIAGDVGKAELLEVLPKLYTGRHVDHPKAEFLLAREVHVAAGEPVALHLDGDVVGHLPATFRLLPRAIQVVAPEGAPAGVWAG
ncbi:MAG: diacylglycerol kinase family lipid kinase [Bacillota bacterium]